MNTLDYILKVYKLSPADVLPRVLLGCIMRRELVHLFNKLEFKTGVEIGVMTGNFGRFLCTTIKGVHMYGVDAYKAYVEDDGLSPYSQEQLGKAWWKATERLACYNYDLIKEYSMDALKRLSLIHI